LAGKLASFVGWNRFCKKPGVALTLALHPVFFNSGAGAGVCLAFLFAAHKFIQ
jgi:hypothetical protein